ncbi:MAG TPA: hypothetical protein VGM81_16005 [Burkholderiaceae bacterium]|jgi:hypothetical protein
MKTPRHALRLASLAVLSFSLTACVTVKMPAATAHANVVDKLRDAKIAPAAVGSFVLAAGKPAQMDKTLSGLRGSSIEPIGGSFSNQLREELVTELKAAGLFDEESDAVITGQLLDSMVDAGLSVGKARLAARFVVTRKGKTVYDKELADESTWPSSFAGPVALPEAINRYSAQYQTLVIKLVEDPDFRAAMAR